MCSPVKPREWEKSLTVKCRLCGGAKCKRCSESAALAKTDSPVLGLHADWVTDRMLGMMRPSSRLIKEYQIVQQFHKLKLAAVFNLTLPGEHPYCGDGLGASGFPYDPEKDLMAEKIRFYNFGWEDMTTPTLSFMLDIVKVMASVLQDGHSKLAVHCHAGYGRTGLAIACCLVFMHNIPPDRAIKIVRRDRPGSIQTSAQAKFVRSFHEYINEATVVFALPFIHDRFSIADMIEQQNRVVHGEKCAGVRLALPRVLDFVCREVEKAAEIAAIPVIHAYVSHTQWQGHEGRSSIVDCVELQEKHLRAVWGDKISDDSSSGIDPATALIAGTSASHVSAVPPPVPANLNQSNHHASQEDLFPIKIAFNVGEWNWADAANQCQTPGCFSGLLLDWLEHLCDPVLESDIVGSVSAAESDSPGTKWKPVNQLPSCVVKSLDRLLTTLRVLVKKAESSCPNGASIVDALSVRTAMALFHLNCSTPVTSLWKHADFVKQLCREWQPPKRLELNLESLQKLGKSASSRKLSHSSSSKALAEGAAPWAPPYPAGQSPTRLTEQLHLEPVLHPRLNLNGEYASPKSKERDPSESSPVRLDFSSFSARSPVELPPMTQDKEERESEPSPVKMEALVPRLVSFDTKKDPEHERCSSPTVLATDKEGQQLVPMPPAALPIEASPHPAHLSAPPPLNKGAGSGGNVYSLPSVRGGERYKNRPM